MQAVAYAPKTQENSREGGVAAFSSAAVPVPPARPARIGAPFWKRDQAKPPLEGTRALPVGHPWCLWGKVFLFTGVLDSLDRALAQQLVEHHGGRCAASVVRDLTHAVVGADAGVSKLSKMRERHGLAVIDELQLFDLVRNSPRQQPTAAMMARFAQKRRTVGAPVCPITGIVIGHADQICGAGKTLSDIPAEPLETRLDVPVASSQPRARAPVQGSAEPMSHPQPSAISVLSCAVNVTVRSPSDIHTAYSSSADVRLVVAPTRALHSAAATASAPKTRGAHVSPATMPDSSGAGPIVSKGPHPPRASLWVDRHAPCSSDQLLGNAQSITQLRKWLTGWCRAARGSGRRQAALLSGLPGCGKTTAAHLVARECGYAIVEYNASDERSARAINAGIAQAVANHTLGGDGGINGLQPTRVVVIMDEVDGMSSGDRGGMRALCEVIDRADAPIVCICNDRASQKVRTLATRCIDLPFVRPSVDALATHLVDVLSREGVDIVPLADGPSATEYTRQQRQRQRQRGLLARLADTLNCDVRRSLNAMQFMAGTEDARNLARLGVNDFRRAVGFDMADVGVMDGAAAAGELMSSQWRATLTIDQQLALRQVDNTFVPLYLYEHYLDCARAGQHLEYARTPMAPRSTQHTHLATPNTSTAQKEGSLISRDALGVFVVPDYESYSATCRRADACRAHDAIGMFDDHPAAVSLAPEAALLDAPVMCPSADGELAGIERACSAAEAFSFSDLLDGTMRTCQDWSLEPLVAVFDSVAPMACVAPGDARGLRKRFPQWLGENSRQRKRRRLLNGLAGHMRGGRLHSMDSPDLYDKDNDHDDNENDTCDSVKEGEISETLSVRTTKGLTVAPNFTARDLVEGAAYLLAEQLWQPLARRGISAVSDILEGMRSYGLSRQDLDMLAEVSVLGARDTTAARFRVAPAAKAALTRACKAAVARASVAHPPLDRDIGAIDGTHATGSTENEDGGDDDRETTEINPNRSVNLATLLITQRAARKRPAAVKAKGPSAPKRARRELSATKTDSRPAAKRARRATDTSKSKESPAPKRTRRDPVVSKVPRAPRDKPTTAAGPKKKKVGVTTPAESTLTMPDDRIAKAPTPPTLQTNTVATPAWPALITAARLGSTADVIPKMPRAQRSKALPYL